MDPGEKSFFFSFKVAEDKKKFFKLQGKGVKKNPRVPVKAANMLWSCFLFLLLLEAMYVRMRRLSSGILRKFFAYFLALYVPATFVMHVE